MLNLFFFVISYFLILYSVLGFGLFFEKAFYKKNYQDNIGYVGLFGIFFLIIYSYYSSLIFAHGFTLLILLS